MRQSSSVIFQLFTGLFCLASNLASCSSGLISIQNLMTMPPSSEISLSKTRISPADLLYSSSEQNPSMGSTIILPYQERSKIVMCPAFGMFTANLQRYVCTLSSPTGAATGTT